MPYEPITSCNPGSGIGQYGRMARAFWEAANLPYDLREVELKDLMRVHGIGPKTARLFLTHTRQNQRLAVLDVTFYATSRGGSVVTSGAQ